VGSGGTRYRATSVGSGVKTDAHGSVIMSDTIPLAGMNEAGTNTCIFTILFSQPLWLSG